MIIDADRLIVGRLATFVAKQALLGETIDIINSERAVITGNKQSILELYKARRSRGDPHYGPYYPRTPERILKRAIRGMLSHKRGRGKIAFSGIKCYKGVPAEFKGKDTIPLDRARLKDDHIKFMTLQRISELL
ncbi:MAG: 50S ribosomal protein L13 [Nanoarchaeota archaeon]